MVRGRCPDVCPPAFRRLPPHSLRACLLFLGQVGVEFEAAVGVPGRPDMSPFLRSSRAHPQNLSPLSALPSLQVPVLAREGRTRDRQMAAALLTAWSQVSVPIQGWRESRRTWGGRTSDWTILQIYGPDMGLGGNAVEALGFSRGAWKEGLLFLSLVSARHSRFALSPKSPPWALACSPMRPKGRRRLGSRAGPGLALFLGHCASHGVWRAGVS